MRREWVAQLPNGTYNVFLATGDPSYTDQISHFDISTGAASVVKLRDPDGYDHYDAHVFRVVVADGKFRLKPSRDAYNAKAVLLRITDLGTDPVPSDLPSGLSATKQAGYDFSLTEARWEDDASTEGLEARLAWKEPGEKSPGGRYLVFRRDREGTYDYESPFASIDRPAGFEALVLGVPSSRPSCFTLAKEMAGAFVPAGNEVCLSPFGFEGITQLAVEDAGSLRAEWKPASADSGVNSYEIFTRSDDGVFDFSNPAAIAGPNATSLGGIPSPLGAGGKGRVCVAVRARAREFVDTNTVETCVPYDAAAYEPLDLAIAGAPSGGSAASAVTIGVVATNVEEYAYAIVNSAPGTQDPDRLCESAVYGAKSPVTTSIVVPVGDLGPKTLCVRGYDAQSARTVTRSANWKRVPPFGGVETFSPTSAVAATVTWASADASIVPLAYDVFLRSDGGAYDFSRPTLSASPAATMAAVALTDASLRHCVVVRVRSQLLTDLNTQEICGLRLSDDQGASSDIEGRIVVAKAPRPGGLDGGLVLGQPLAGPAAAVEGRVGVDGGLPIEEASFVKVDGSRIAVSFLYDVSGSIGPVDFATLSALNRSLLTCVPQGAKTQVAAFGTDYVEVKSFASSDDPSVALGRRPLAAGSATALYRSIKTAAENLASEGSDVRLLIVSTDGQNFERGSQVLTTLAQARGALEASRVVPIVIGSARARPATLLPLSNGIGFYSFAPEIAGVNGAPLCSLLDSVREIRSPASGDGPFSVEVGGRAYRLP